MTPTASRGRRRAMLIAPPALGAIAACGFQPLALWPLALLGLAGLIALGCRAERARDAALAGWLWGIGHFTVGNFWIATAFTYQAKMPAWLGAIAVFLLSLYLALFPALAMLGGWWLGRGGRVAGVLAGAGCWATAEMLRGWVCTGFPWNPLGAVALGPFARPGLAGWLLPWMGTYALSGLVFALAGCWWLALARRRFDAPGAALALVPAALLALVPAPGAGPQGTVAFTLVQPDIEQGAIGDPARFGEQFEKTTRLSTPLPGQARRLVLWPESGVPDYLREGYPAEWYQYSTAFGDPVAARMRLARVIGPDAVLLTGAEDLVFRGGDVVAGRNVITAIDGRGRIVGSYAKAHLVPYGEYLPMRGLLEPLGLSRLVPGAIDFLPGPGPRTLDLGPLGKVGGQICYEIVFSGEVVDRAHRPDFIFNPTNDGWFGAWGPPQHLAQARMRAIEEGLPVLRATTNGISAAIDARGVVRAAIPRGRAGRIDMAVPPAAPPTWFARWGNGLALAWAGIALALAQVAKRLGWA